LLRGFSSATAEAGFAAAVQPGYIERMDHHEIIATDGTRLVYGRVGQGTGPAVLLCHGLCSSGAQFAADAQWFAERGYDVLLPDLRGHGRSGMPDQVTDAAFAPERLWSDVDAMLNHAGVGRVHWVGNSLGGIVGLVASRDRPERLASLTLFGTALALDLPPLGWTLPLLDRVPGRAVAAQITARNTTRNRQAWPLIETMLAHYDAQAGAAIVRHIRRYDLTAVARAWMGPGLVLVGGEDKAVNRVLIGQLDALRGQANWRIEHLAEGGHCANLDATEAWRRALGDFVEGAIAGGSPAP
jgi:pimeloyl-ACP methyl ester carboxylesterase